MEIKCQANTEIQTDEQKQKNKTRDLTKTKRYIEKQTEKMMG